MLCQVGDGAGFGNRGWADAISMQTWPSKDLLVTGYEVKATRSDWLRELDKPEKNAAWQKQCHEWYVVAPKEIIKIEELPARWGLLIPRGEDGLRIAVRSEKNGDDLKMVPLDLMAAVFRASENERRHLERATRLDIQTEERERASSELERWRGQAREVEQRYTELAEALGDRWETLEKLKNRALAVRQLNEHDDPRGLLRGLRERLENTALRLKDVEDSMMWENGQRVRDDDDRGR